MSQHNAAESRGRTGGARLRAGLVRCALLVAGFAFALLVVEGALRLGLAETEPFLIGRETRAAGERPRVLILGDSFSVEIEGADWDGTAWEGIDVDKTATLQLREWLEGRGAHVLNLAERASGPEDYLARFDRFGRAYEPDLVLVNYYVGNDAVDAKQRLRPSWTGRAMRALMRVSHLGYFARDVRRSLASRGYQDRQETAGLLNPVLVEFGRRNGSQYVDSLLLDSPAAESAFASAQETLLELVGRGEGRTRFLLSLFPPAVQINTSHFEFLEELGFATDPRFLETSLHQERMLAFCERHALDCLDMLEAFRARADETLYLEGDTHWNAAGNDLAFELLRRRVAPLLAQLGAG